MNSFLVLANPETIMIIPSQSIDSKSTSKLTSKLVDTVYHKNYNVLSFSYRTPIEKKVAHIRGILNRGYQKENDNTPDFMRLIFELRLRCLVIAYFPKGNRFQTILDEDLEAHRGWDDFMTEEESRLLNGMKRALMKLKMNSTDFDTFEAVDKKFGKYRHERWIKELE